jgi:putative FmdB family regulatory protein
MPIYEYKCLKCGEVSEFLVGVGPHSEAIECKVCGSREMQRVLSPASFSMKGLQKGGLTCCGSEERCDSPPCSTGASCRRDRSR